MNKKIFIHAICIIAICTCAVAGEEKSDKDARDTDFAIGMLMDSPKPMFMMPPTQMMPAPARMAFPPKPESAGMASQIKLTDRQREKMRNLEKKHHEEMKSLHDARDELREEYQEKFEAVLTDEQFRQIEKMRKDLRREMKKLNDKQQKMMESHRSAFESILTTEQKKELERIFHARHVADKQPPAPATDARDADAGEKQPKKK